MVPFDPEQPYRKSEQVALRPERFGALAYHFGTRRLSFLKTPTLVEVVRTLQDFDDVHATLDAAGVGEQQREGYLAALADLAAAGTIEPVSAEQGYSPSCHSRRDRKGAA